MTKKSMADLDMLDELRDHKKYLIDLNTRKLVNDLENIDMPQFLIDDIVNYVPVLIEHYDAEIDKAAKIFVDTWLAYDGGES